MHDEQILLLKKITMAFYLPAHLHGLAWSLQKRFDQTRYEWLSSLSANDTLAGPKTSDRAVAISDG